MSVNGATAGSLREEDARPAVLVSFFDLGCAIGATSICAHLIANGQPAKLMHFGLCEPYHSMTSLRLLQCRGFLNISYISPPPDSLYESAVERIAALNPLVVGLSIDSRMTYFADRLTQRLRQHLPDVPIIWGGVHPTIAPEHAEQYVETVCEGEGEEALLEVCRRLRRGERDFRGIVNLRGVAPDGSRYCNGRTLIKDLDALAVPFLDPSDVLWEPEDSHTRMLSLSNYDGGHFFRAYSMMASRGCLFKCTYCYAQPVREAFAGNGESFVRRRSLDHIFEELHRAKALPYIEFVWFWDDIFGSNPKWLEEFAERYPGEIGLPFSCHLMPGTTTDRAVKALKKAGCHSVGIGMQTGSARIHRDVYQRPFDRKQVLEMAARTHPAFPTYYDIIVDNPYETEDDLRETLLLFLEMPRPFYIASNTLIWYPGQAITRAALKEGLIKEKDVVGIDTSGEYKYQDITFRHPGPSRKAQRHYAWNLLICATQHPIIPGEQLLEWSRDDELLENPKELERLLSLHYLCQSEADVLRLEYKVVGKDVEIAGLRARLQEAEKALNTLGATT